MRRGVLRILEIKARPGRVERPFFGWAKLKSMALEH
jgi:hypothetical protein